MLILINLFAHLGNDEEETENNEMLPRNTNKRKKNCSAISELSDGCSTIRNTVTRKTETARPISTQIKAST